MTITHNQSGQNTFNVKKCLLSKMHPMFWVQWRETGIRNHCRNKTLPHQFKLLLCNIILIMHLHNMQPNVILHTLFCIQLLHTLVLHPVTSYFSSASSFFNSSLIQLSSNLKQPNTWDGGKDERYLDVQNNFKLFVNHAKALFSICLKQNLLTG